MKKRRRSRSKRLTRLVTARRNPAGAQPGRERSGRRRRAAGLGVAVVECWQVEAASWRRRTDRSGAVILSPLTLLAARVSLLASRISYFVSPLTVLADRVSLFSPLESCLPSLLSRFSLLVSFSSRLSPLDSRPRPSSLASLRSSLSFRMATQVGCCLRAEDTAFALCIHCIRA